MIILLIWMCWQLFAQREEILESGFQTLILILFQARYLQYGHHAPRRAGRGKFTVSPTLPPHWWKDITASSWHYDDDSNNERWCRQLPCILYTAGIYCIHRYIVHVCTCNMYIYTYIYYVYALFLIYNPSYGKGESSSLLSASFQEN